MREDPMAESRACILVVDDERFFREAIAEVLEDRGLICDVCEDGESALELCEKEEYPVVVLDIRLPGIDGIEVLRSLREARPHTRVIMLSASTDQELVLEAMRLGACDYLAKPLHDEELALAVQRAASSHGIEKSRDALRGRLDRLVGRLQELSDVGRETAGAELEARVALLAGEIASEVFDARKTSLMRLDREESSLEVVSMVGRDIELREIGPVPMGQGVAWLALQEGRPLVVQDMRADDRLTQDPDNERYDTEAFAIVPVGVSEGWLGVLCVTDRVAGSGFADEDVSLLRLLALQVAEALTRESRSPAPAPADDVTISLDTDSSDHVTDTMPLDLARDVVEAAGICGDAAAQDSEIARQVCEAVVSEVDPERVLAGVVRTLERELAADPVGIFLLSGRSGGLSLEVGSEGGLRQEREMLPGNRGLTGAAVQARHLIATTVPSEDPRFDPEVDTAVDGKAGPLLCIPLRFRGKVIGIARIHLAEGAHVSARTGEILGSALSAAIRNVLLYRSLVESMDEVAAVRREARG